MSGDSDRIAIEQLRYVRLGTKDLTAAADFAQRILGLQLIDQAGEQITSGGDFIDWRMFLAGDRSASKMCAESFRFHRYGACSSVSNSTAGLITGHKINKGELIGCLGSSGMSEPSLECLRSRLVLLGLLLAAVPAEARASGAVQ